MDGSYSLDSSISGIRGIFWGQEGKIFFNLGKQVSTDSTIQTEVLAIQEGILIVVVSKWSTSSSFIIEFDSQNTILWFSIPYAVPWKFQNGRNISWSIVYFWHMGNELANILVRLGAIGSSFI